MTEPTQPPEHGPRDAWWQPTSLLTPAPCAIAALAVAVSSFRGQNLLLIGFQSLLGQGFWSNNSPAAFYTVWGLATIVPLVLVALLSRTTLRVTQTGWESHLARAALILAVVTAAGAVLTTLGGAVHGGVMPF